MDKTPVVCELFGEGHMTHCVVLDETCTLAEGGTRCHAEFTGETHRIFYLDLHKMFSKLIYGKVKLLCMCVYESDCVFQGLI